MKTEVDPIVGHIKKLIYTARACEECVLDIDDARHQIQTNYVVDFSLLAPVLFNRPSPESAPFLESKRDEMVRILNEATVRGGFKLVLSAPTIVEFLDQLNHTQRQYRHHFPRLRDKYANDSTSILRSPLTTSREIRRELAMYTREGIEQRVKAPVNKLLDLMDRKVLLPIGDVTDVEVLHSTVNSELFARFVEEHTQRRLGFDTTRRSQTDSIFHYRMDAANTCMIVAAAAVKNGRTLLVTPTPLNLEQCVVNRVSYGRVDHTPLFRINLAHMKEAHRGKFDEFEFLRRTARAAILLETELRQYSKFEDCPPYLQYEVGWFYLNQLGVLGRPWRGDENSVTVEKLDEIARIASNPKLLKDAVDEADQLAKDGAQAIAKYAARFDVPYLEQFEFKNDPVLERLTRELGVPLKI